METATFPSDSAGVQVSKMLHAAGLAPSRAEADRLIKAGAVEINGTVWRELKYPDGLGELTIRVGKKWKKVQIQ